MKLPALLFSVALLGLGACAEDNPSAGTSADTSPSAAQESATPSPSATSDAPSSSPTPDAGATVEITIKGDGVSPQAEPIELETGETLTLKVLADRAGELHVHSDPEHEFAFEAGRHSFPVTFKTPGSIDIEEHESGALVVRALVR